MAMSKDEILSAIRKVVTTTGTVPGERSFEIATGIKGSAWKGWHWARWTDAVRDAGYDPNAMNQRIPDDRLLGALADFVIYLGRFPVREEINMRARTVEGFPVYQTLHKRYGGMSQTATALLKHGGETGNAALETICRARLEFESAKEPDLNKGKPRRTTATLGCVYLKYSPSLRLYKIGKANDADKRGAGISLLLPEDLIPKHEIKTDYPFVLEKYWEHRFRAKKKKGEWYDLSAQDINSFKKRREFLFAEFFPDS